MCELGAGPGRTVPPDRRGGTAAPLSSRGGAGTRPWFRWRFRPWAGTRGSRGGARPRSEQRWAHLGRCLRAPGTPGKRRAAPSAETLNASAPRRRGQLFVSAGREVHEQRECCALLSALQLRGALREGARRRLLTVADPQGWREGAARWRGSLDPGDFIVSAPPHPFGYPGERGWPG